MNQRRIVDEHIKFVIEVDRPYGYKVDYTWRELMATKGILPTDIIHDIYMDKRKESGMFSMKMEDELEYFYIPVIEIIRKRPETDDEFLKRKQTEEQYKKQTEEREKLEYLRLKAKFENI